MSTESNKLAVRSFVTLAQCEGDLDAIELFLPPDFVDHCPLPGLPGDREGVRALFTGLWTAFPDLSAQIHDQVAEGDKVVTRKTLSGTHTGPFMGLPPTGNRVTFDVIDVLRLHGGKLVEHWCVVDQLSLLRGVGALPPAVP